MVVANGGSATSYHNHWQTSPEWGSEIEVGHYSNSSELFRKAKGWLIENVGEEYRDWSLMPRVNDNDHLYVGPLKTIGFVNYKDAWNFLEWLEENDKH